MRSERAARQARRYLEPNQTPGECGLINQLADRGSTNQLAAREEDVYPGHQLREALAREYSYFGKRRAPGCIGRIDLVERVAARRLQPDDVRASLGEELGDQRRSMAEPDVKDEQAVKRRVAVCSHDR